MAEVDDAAILKRAKALCEEAGVAWDGLSATAPGTRVLNDRDRRECLMRARHELMTDGETGGEAEGKNRPGAVVGAASEVAQVPNAGNMDDPSAKSSAREPTRRVA